MIGSTRTADCLSQISVRRTHHLIRLCEFRKDAIDRVRRRSQAVVQNAIQNRWISVPKCVKSATSHSPEIVAGVFVSSSLYRTFDPFRTRQFACSMRPSNPQVAGSNPAERACFPGVYRRALCAGYPKGHLRLSFELPTGQRTLTLHTARRGTFWQTRCSSGASSR